MPKPSTLLQIVLCGQWMFTGSWRTFAKTRISCFWTLNSAKHSASSCFEDQILHTNCAENLGSWSGSSPTRPRIHRLRLCYHHTLVTASFLFHEKTLFAKVFLSFRGRFREKLPSQKHLCLTLYFSGNDGALLPRLARLLTSQSPLKRLVLKFPIILSRPTQWFVHSSPQYSHITLVSEYPFWQLSIYHNMDVHTHTKSNSVLNVFKNYFWKLYLTCFVKLVLRATVRKYRLGVCANEKNRKSPNIVR